MANSNERLLSFSTKSSYGVGQLAEGLKNTAFGTFLLFFYTDVVGLEPAVAGVALTLALIFDAVSDPMIGYVSDNWQSKWGRRHPFMYVCCVPLAIFFYFTFTPPEAWVQDSEAHQVELFIWLLTFAILTRAAMTLYHVPHLSLGAEFTSHPTERTAIVSWRTMFQFGGNLLCLYLAFQVFFAPTEEFARGQLNPAAYPGFAIFLSVLMLLTVWLSAIGTHKEIPYLPKVTPSSKTMGQVLKEAFSPLFNRSFFFLFVGVVSIYVMVGIVGSLGLYLNTYFWNLDNTQILLVSVALPIGTILMSPLTRLTNGYFGKRNCLIYGSIIWALLTVIPPILRLMDVLPENGTTSLFIFLVFMSFLSGMAASQGIVTFGSMVADIADEHEYKTGRRQEGGFFGAIAFAGKASSGLGTAVTGFGLSFIVLWPRSNPDAITAEHIFDLGLFFGPAVILFAMIAVGFYSLYSLTPARHRQILDELVVRRAEAAKSGLQSEPQTTPPAIETTTRETEGSHPDVASAKPVS